MPLPDFVLIAAPRSGSTTIYHYLDKHNDVFMAKPKEIRFFDQNWERGRDWYENHFAASHSGQLRGEASPTYMSDKSSMERLVGMMPQAKLVAVLRNPADSTHSWFHYRKARGLETGSLEQALEREIQGDTETFPYLRTREYAKHLDHVENELGRPVSLLWYDDLTHHPSILFDDLAALLGIAPFDVTDTARVVNSADRFRSVRLRTWAKSAPSIVQRAVGRVNRVATSYPALSPQTRRQIIDHLEPSIAALEARANRDLTAWRH